MTEKVLGYILIAAGLMAIVYAVLNLFSVFYGKTQPVQLFNFSGISLDVAQLVPQNLPPEASGLIQEQPSGPQKTEILPANILNQSSNIFAHLLLMGFLASAGQKVASIGTSLVRPINVKLKKTDSP
ncbi:hypothetical protein IID21_04330 [Patescibacteria group bacterium]|nr:hypothetical protein [Patescibacteria group bacterium]